MSTDPRHSEASDRPDDADRTSGPTPAGEETAPATDQRPSPGPLPGAGEPVPSTDTGPAMDAAAPGATSPATDDWAGGDDATRAYPDSSGATAPAGPGSPVGSTSPADPAPVARGDEPTVAVPASPTAAEDDALRAERARRFGRFGATGANDDEPAPEEVRTTALPAPAGPAPTEPAYAATGRADQTRGPDPARDQEVNEDDPFDDWDEPPRSRAQAHWWVVLITLVFTPPAWYLITDGGERWSHAREVAPEAINVAGLVEIVGGLILLAAVLIGARWSSVGPIIVGSIATLIGGAFLAIPQMVEDFLAEYIEVFNRLGQFGTNVYNHLLMDGNTGRILAYGVVLIFAGVISHGARRQGRREERRRAAVEAL